MSQITPVVPRMDPPKRIPSGRHAPWVPPDPLGPEERSQGTKATRLARRMTIAVSGAAEKSHSFQLSNAFYQNLWMGAVSGIIGLTAVYPMDITKTNIQNYRGPPPTPSIPVIIRNILRAEGPMGLYKGLIPQISGAGPEKAVTLATRDFLRHVLPDQDSQLTFLLSGMGAGAVQSTVVNPVEAVKVRVQLTAGKGNVIGTMRQLGLRKLYTGYSACLPRDIAFAGLYFTMYENLKIELNVVAEDASLRGMLLKMTTGILAGAPAALVTTPLDVIKTRLQAPTRAADEGFFSVMHQLRKTEGMRGLFKGWQPRVGRIAPQYAIVLMVYEKLQSGFKLSSPSSSSPPPPSPAAAAASSPPPNSKWR